MKLQIRKNKQIDEQVTISENKTKIWIKTGQPTKKHVATFV